MRKSNWSGKILICLCAALIVSSTLAAAMSDNLIVSEQDRENQRRNNSKVLYRAESTLEDDGTSSLKSSKRIDALLAVGKKPFLFANGDWCGFSLRQKRAIGEIEQEYGGYLDSIWLNTEVYHKKAEEFEVLGYPTMFLIHGKGDDSYYSKLDKYTDRGEPIAKIENTINSRNLRDEQPMYSEHNKSVTSTILPAQFTDVYADCGLDTDSNGLYDYLAIDLGVNVSELWYYYVSGYLYNNNSGYYIDSISNYATLSAGNQTVQLRFNGARIWQSRTNGTFDLKYLSLYNAIDQSELDYRSYAYTTNSYNYTNFRPPAVFMPGVKDYGHDENSNGLYDYLVVEKQVNVTTAGNYEVDGYLYNDSGYWIDSNYNYPYLSAGIHNLTLTFSGYAIYNSKSTGNFTVYMNLYGGDVGWRWLDSAENLTSYYSYAQFERPPAELGTGFRDYGLDTNGNGFYDYLVIEKQINVTTAGNYELDGSLYNDSGYWLDSNYNYTYLSAGMHNLTLTFSGYTIYNSKSTGNFTVYMNLYGGDVGWRWLDSAEDITSYYSYAQFERPPAQITDVYADCGLDMDGNGLYDYLAIDVGVNVSTSGNYSVEVDLHALGGTHLTENSTYLYLPAGNQNVTVLLDGIDIRGNKINGPFVLDDVWLWDDSDNLLDYRNDPFITQYYNYTDFQRPPAELGTEFRDYGLDTNGNGFYDYLVIEKQINVTTAGDYELDGSLYNDSGYWIDSNYNYTYLSAGMHNLTLTFSGYAIYNSKSTGNFMVYMNLYGGDVGWRWLDSAEDITSYYSYAQFEQPPAQITDVYADRGLDTDSNGLYDYLAIDVGVNVSTSGNYSVEVDLHALDGTHLTENSTYSYLPAGNQNVTVLLDGLDIRVNKINGPFVLDDVWLWDDDYNLLDYRNDPFITQYYNYTDFQRPPAELGTEFRDYGLDTNGNVLYDYLVIEKQINVTTAGNYELDGYLYNDSGYWIDSNYNYTYLSAGIHNLTLTFIGYMIYNSESSGNFTVYMDLYGGDVDWRWLDSAENLTGYYSYAQFERPPAELGTEFRDYGLDTNGNVLYDYLAIEKQINVTIAGNYELDGSLYNDSGYEIDSKYNYTYLSEGIHNLTLKFNGYKIYHSESSGNFTVYMDLYGGEVSWRLLDSAENLTSYYSYAQFERPRADVLVALFEDSYPWGYTAIEDQLWANGILFTIYDSSDMGKVDLMPYTKVITASVQSNTFWDALAGNKAWFENYVSQGGVLEMHLCAQQSHTAWGKVFPGGFVTAWGTTNTISIVDTTHPVVNIPNKITDQDLDQWGWSAHGNFSTIPAGATVVLTATDTGKSVFVEAKLGKGSIIATTQTVEWRAGHRYPEFLENMVLFMLPATYFDTGAGTYPSIAGTHNGTITPLGNITVSNLYTYPCPGTGGHTEYMKIWNSTGWNVTATWDGYAGDWHNLSFNQTFTLYANETYNYTIRTGSYPQIIHEPSWSATGGVITCTELVDINGKRHEGWIPAIRLE